mmetsp:Transcript_26482/g.56323  ORF Transcript_26482/g.56323 Transcript_26482/m.56323 type:complete len:405 (+) Transcript_26482:53-1267(+)
MTKKTKMKFTTSAISAITLAIGGTANAQSIYEFASGNDSFTTLTAAVDAAGLDATLTGDGTFTIFAPTNDAFDALPAGTVDKLLQPEWIHHLTDVLLYHGLGSVVMSTDLTDGLSAETLNGESITINLDPAVITTVSNTTSNILVDAGLVDIAADNGVIHAVDAVLLPTSATSSIVDLAVADPVFSTLVAAVTAADLVGALSGDGPFTLFAPTNDAFDALPEGTLDSLLLPENKDELARILSYHVVQGNVHSSTITADVDVTTLSGHDVSASIPSEADGTFRLNNGAANVIFPDFLASNGIIHVIDAVLIPPEEDNVTTATNTTAMSMTTAITTTAADSVADDGETETDATEMSAATTTTTVAPGEETVGEGEETVEGDSGAGMNNALGALGVLVAASWSMNWW